MKPPSGSATGAGAAQAQEQSRSFGFGSFSAIGKQQAGGHATCELPTGEQGGERGGSRGAYGST